jgi:RNA polymerase sigma factor for flagellar operon FliA
MNQTDLQDTWKQFFASQAAGLPDRTLQNKLVEHYHGLLRIVGSKMHAKHNQFTVDELTSMGTFGLYDAVMGYDPERKVKFETYAMPRLRGAVLDAIRQIDWVPRLVRSNNTKLDRERNVHESNAGHRLSEPELAEKMRMSDGDFSDLVKGSATPVMHSMNGIQTENDQGKSLSIDHVEDRRSALPGERLLRKELFDKLMGRNFTPQERKIIWLYYIEDISMKEISQVVNLSESRVSQMHADILDRLRQKAERNPEYFSDIWSFVSGFRETVVA